MSYVGPASWSYGYSGETRRRRASRAMAFGFREGVYGPQRDGPPTDGRPVPRAVWSLKDRFEPPLSRRLAPRDANLGGGREPRQPAALPPEDGVHTPCRYRPPERRTPSPSLSRTYGCPGPCRGPILAIRRGRLRFGVHLGAADSHPAGRCAPSVVGDLSMRAVLHLGIGVLRRYLYVGGVSGPARNDVEDGFRDPVPGCIPRPGDRAQGTPEVSGGTIGGRDVPVAQEGSADSDTQSFVGPADMTEGGPEGTGDRTRDSIPGIVK